MKRAVGGGFFFFVLGVLVWTWSVGSKWLALSESLLVGWLPLLSAWKAGRVGHPLGLEIDPYYSGLARIVSWVPGDVLVAWSLTEAALKLMLLSFLVLGVRSLTASWTAGLTSAALLFLASPTYWFMLDLPGTATYLGQLAVLLAMGRKSPEAALVFSLLLVRFHPPSALAVLPMLLLPLPIAYGKMRAVAASLILGIGLVFAGPELDPELVMAHWYFLALGAAFFRDLTIVRLALLWEIGLSLVGAPGAGVVLAGALALGLALHKVAKPQKCREESTAPAAAESQGVAAVKSGVSLRLSGPTIQVFGFCLVLGVFCGPGESLWNRELLIAFQKAHFSMVHLVWPPTVEQRVREGTPPFGDFDPSMDFPLVDLLKEDTESETLAVLTRRTGEQEAPESLETSAVLAILSGRDLHGWGPSMEQPSLRLGAQAAKVTGDPLPAGSDTVYFREAGDVRKESDCGGRRETVQNGSIPTLFTPRPVPGLWQTLSPGGGLYQLAYPDGFRETVVFSEQTPAIFRLPTASGPYEFGSGVANQPQKFTVDPPQLEVSYSPSDPLPSRSLVPVQVLLQNKGTTAFFLGRWEQLVLRPQAGESFESVAQTIDNPGILTPGESQVLNLTLVTPEAEGTYSLELLGYDERGNAMNIPWERPVLIRTWRRLPPVGTWIEDP